ncbi:zinc finger protein 25 isoform X2 [Drosophila novamexicana]|uniref:zinc finger protein 25 isoform X2 n=1 Tax=Drosophila novamexicana TaxID=47314 RepID=UPI0011E5C0D9|nr:zinc finger protein 25 isoform X2 [Drosophila novamexicana]
MATKKKHNATRAERMSKCPRCNCVASGQNRLVTDSCGHSKCRLCLLADVSDCSECKITRDIPEPDADPPEQPVTVVKAIAHTTANHITSTTQGYHCTVCNKYFRSRTQQYYHRACGNEQLKKFHCTQCPRRFATRSHLKYHQNSHGNNFSYSCSICNKSFKQQLLLQRHMRAHNLPAFSCQNCPRLFRSQSALTVHAALHSGDSLPHKCVTCCKQYLTKANLKQHQLKHDQNSARHSCSVCNKSFLRSSTLRLHQKRHSKRPRHACSQCNKTFNDADALTRHIKQHTAMQHYRCMQCEVTVNRRDNMLRHLRSMHPGVQFEAGVHVIEAEPSNPATPTPAETSVQNQRYNSVIKSVGNVEPVMVPIAQPELEPEKPPPAAAPMPDKTQKENVKLYRKIILDLDNEEYSNELDMDEPETVANAQQVTLHTKPQHQRVPGQGSSNFRHWRKNFKYSYENEHTN